MADGIEVTPGTGKLIAGDDVAGELYQRIKLTLGSDGVNDGDVSAANPIPSFDTSLSTKLGEVQASPTANTVLARLKDISTALSLPLVISGIDIDIRNLTKTQDEVYSVLRTNAGVAYDARDRSWTITETVPVSVSSLPLPLGAAQQTTLSSLLTELQLKADLTEIQPVSATNLDIRDLTHTSDSVRIGDGVDLATVRTLGSAGALDVSIVDGSGNQITSFGSGGTQFAEDAPLGSTPTGTLSMARRDDTLGTLTPVDDDAVSLRTNSRGALWTKHDGAIDVGSIASALPAGTNNIGDVDVLSLPALAAGTNNIGDVDVLTLPAVTQGTSPWVIGDGGGAITVDASDLDIRNLVFATDKADVSGSTVAATQSGSWVVSANAGTNLNTSALALETGGNLQAGVASLAILDDWDESDRAKVNLIVGEAGISAAAGVVTLNTPRVTLASDDPGVLALEDILFELQSGIAVSGTIAATQSGTWNVGLNAGINNIGDVDVLTLPAVTQGTSPWVIGDGGGSITIDGTVAVSGTVAVTQSGSWTVTANAGTNLNTSALALESTLSALNAKVTAVNTGAVTISAALPAGANNIGDVDVLTLPAVTQGTSPWIVADGAGSITVDAPVGTPVFVRLSDGTSPITTLPVSLSSVPSHAVTNAGVFVVQENGAALTSLQLLDDCINAINTSLSKAAVIAGHFDDASTTAATEDSVAPVRITAQRAFHTNLRNVAGTEVGTSGAPLRIDPTGSTIQPVSGTVAATQSGTWNVGLNTGTNNIGDVDILTLPAVTQGTSPWVIGDGGGSITVDGSLSISGAVDTELPPAAVLADNFANPTAPAVGAFNMGWDGTTWDRIRADGGAIFIQDGGNSITVDGTIGVSGTVPVTQSGTWNLTNISGTVSLPTGAATSALQTQPGVDIGDVTVNNASGVAAVNIQDGGNSITVDGVVAATQSGTWNITNISGTVSLPTGAASAALQTQPGVDIGDVTVNNAAGGGAVNIQDGGNSITIDGSVAVSGTVAVTQSGSWTVQDNASQVDDAAFTPATGRILMIGAEADETSPDAVDEGDGGALRMTLQRGLHVNLRNASGTEVGVSGAALRVDPTGTTAQPITDNAGSLTVDAPVGTPVFVRLSDGTSPIATLPVSLASVPTHAVTIASGGVASGAIASGAIASGAVASGAFASGSISAGAVVAGASSFVKLEDAASASADAGVPAMAIQRAAPGDTAADLDYSMLQMSAGRLWTSSTIDAALPAGANAIGKLAANSGVDIGDVDITSILPGIGATNLGKAEDAAHVSGDVGVMVLGVRQDVVSVLAPDGDYAPLSLDASGAARVTGSIPANTTFASQELLLIAGIATAASPTYALGSVNALSLRSGIGGGQLRVDGSSVTQPISGAIGISSPMTGSMSNDLQTDIASLACASKALIYDSVDASWERVRSANADSQLVGVPVSGLYAYNGATWDRVTKGAGTEATALRVTIANDSTGVLSVDDNGGSLTVDGTVAVSSISTSITPGTAAANLGKAEDAAHASGDVGVMALAVRQDSASALAADGDYIPLTVDANGALRTTATVSGAALAEAAFQVEGTIAFGALTTSYASVKNLADNTKIVFLVNNTDATILWSLDGGTTLHFTTPRGGIRTLDLATNTLKSTGDVQAKYSGSAPSSGAVYVDSVV